MFHAGIAIKSQDDLHRVFAVFHSIGVKHVVITSVELGATRHFYKRIIIDVHHRSGQDLD